MFIFCVAYSFAFGQATIKFDKGDRELANFEKVQKINSKDLKGPAPVWQVTFDEATPTWTMGHSATTSKDWVTGDEASRPCYWGPLEADGTGWYVYAMDYLYSEMGETETPGTYAYIDIVGDRADLYGNDLPAGCTMDGTGQNPFDAWILFEDIDMTNVDVPYLMYYNSFHESNAVFFDCFVEYSFDDGANWTSVVVNPDSEGNGWHYGEYGIGLTECANQANVDLRFRHVSDPAFTVPVFEQYPSSWAWLIDNVRLFDYTDFGISYDLIVKDTRVNFFEYIDYLDPEWADYNVYHYSSYYGQAPQEQYASADGGFLWFNISLENNGAETVTPKVNVKVTDPYDVVVFDEVVDGVVTPFTGADTLDMIEVDCILPLNTNDPAQVPTGRYEVTFNAFVEGHEADDYYQTDNVDTAYFLVSDRTFSREADDITGSMGAASWSDGGGDGDGIGTTFNIYYEDDVNSVDVFIDEETTEGAMINIEINEYDGDNDVWTPVLTSDPLIIDASHLGQWVNVTFDDPYSVTFGADETSKELLVGVICYYNGGDIFIGESTENTHSSYSTRWKFADGDGTWGGISNHAGGPAIRLNYGPLNDETVNNLIANELEGISLYPNPTTGILYLNGVEGADVQISNMMGQVVESIENSNEFNQVDMSSYANGTYFVKVVVDNKVTTRKINLMK